MPDVNLSLFLGFLGALMLLGVAALEDAKAWKDKHRDNH